MIKRRWQMLAPFFTIILLLFSASCFGSVTETREIEVAKPRYPVPMSTVEGYAKSKLVRKISVERIRYVWSAQTSVSFEQKKFLEDSILKFSNDDFELNGLKLQNTSFRTGSYFFKFEYEPPTIKNVHLSDSDVLLAIQRLDPKTRREYLIPLTNMMLANKTLFSDERLREHWTTVLPNSSFDALFLKKVNDFAAVKFIVKRLPDEQLPNQLTEALKLFDLAPFNKKICDKVLALLSDDTPVFANRLRGHCVSLPNVVLVENVSNADQPKSEKIIKFVVLKNKKLENEINTLTNVEGVTIVDRPLLLSILTLPKKYQFDNTAFFGENSASRASTECLDRKLKMNSTFGVKKLSNLDVAALISLFKAKNFTELESALSERLGHYANQRTLKANPCLVAPDIKNNSTKHHNDSKIGAF